MGRDGRGARQLIARVARLAGWGYPARMIGAAEAAELEPRCGCPRGARVGWFPAEGYLLTGPLIGQLTGPRCSAGSPC